MRAWLPLCAFACGPRAEAPSPEPVEPVPAGPEAQTPTSTAPLLPESRVRLVAGFHIDEATGLPGSWTDEDGETRPAEVELLVGDDEYDAVNGTFCRVRVPIDPQRTTLRASLESDQLWGVDFSADRSSITTDCDEPGFEAISHFYDDDVIGFVNTNQDGSSVVWSIVVEEPSSTAVDWLEGPSISGNAVLGGEMGLSDRLSGGWSPSFAGFALETDDEATVTVDADGELTFVPLDDLAAGPGIRQGAYRLIGYRFTTVMRDER
ncbi:MAG: hypothetical protein AAF211_05945 [Myxococcota bacterium]